MKSRQARRKAESRSVAMNKSDLGSVTHNSIAGEGGRQSPSARSNGIDRTNPIREASNSITHQQPGPIRATADGTSPILQGIGAASSLNSGALQRSHEQTAEPGMFRATSTAKDPESISEVTAGFGRLGRALDRSSNVTGQLGLTATFVSGTGEFSDVRRGIDKAAGQHTAAQTYWAGSLRGGSSGVVGIGGRGTRRRKQSLGLSDGGTGERRPAGIGGSDAGEETGVVLRTPSAMEAAVRG